jgi:membrane fusion protein (multidrug efflux system)
MKKALIITLIVLAAGGGIAWQLNANQEHAESEIAHETRPLKVVVNAAPVKAYSFPKGLQLSGTVEANQTLQLVSETDGKVTHVLFSTGDQVTAGQVLARTRASVKEASYQLAKATLEKAQQDYNRIKALYEEKNTSQTDLEAANLQLKNAESQLATAAHELQNATITSPINGTVAEKKIGTGDYLQAGSPVALINDLSKVKIRVNVPEKEVVSLQKGDRVSIVADAFPGKTFKGSITAIIPQGSLSGSFPVEIQLYNNAPEKLLSGMHVQVGFQEGESLQALAIPRTAIVYKGKACQVLVVGDKGRIEVRQLQTGRAHGRYVQVLEGLKEGEKVIVSGQQSLDLSRPADEVKMP